MEEFVSKNRYFLNAVVVGLGLALSGDLSAQTSSPGTSGGQVSSPTGNVIDLRNDAAYSIMMSGRSSGPIQLSNLLNSTVQAQDGAFGTVSDVVFDRNGNIQYLLGSYQGQTFPLPLTSTTLSAAGNTLTYNVPIAALQQLAINQQNLPTLQNQAFMQRMQQVFGPTVGNGLATPPGMTTQSGRGQLGTGAASPFGTTTMGGRLTTGAASAVGVPAADLTTGASAFRTPVPAGVNSDNWNWPANATSNVSGTVTGRYSPPPGTLSGGGGIGTGRNGGFRSSIGTTNNPGFGITGQNTTGAGRLGTGTGMTSGINRTTSGAGTNGSGAGTGSGTGTAGSGAAPAGSGS